MLKTVSSIVNAIGALNYKGTWDANTNTPTLVSSVGTKGDYYVVSVAGSTNLNGETNWGVGDWAVFNGSVWQKVDGGSTGNFTDITVSNSATLSYGTANGVAYLNGSKVLTTGSALSFDGTSLGVSGPVRLTATATAPSVNNEFVAYSINGYTYLTGGTTGLILANNAGSDTRIRLEDANNIQFEVNSVEQMRLTSTGLGIGTSSPRSALDVAGTGAASWSFGANSLKGVVTIGAQGTTTSSLVVNTAGLSAGFPAGFAVDGTYSNPGGIGTAVIRLQALGVASGGGYDSAMTFWTSSGATATEKARINSAGNVGIGTSSPSAKLHVVGNQFRQNDATSSQGYVINTTSATTTLATLFGGSSFAIQTGGSGTNQFLLDSSGNLGLGVTPSAWNVGSAIDISSRGSLSDSSAVGTSVGRNAYYNAGWKYKLTSASQLYLMDDGGHKFFTAASGTAGNAISFTQAMTLTSDGKLLVGRTASSGSPYSLELASGSADNRIGLFSGATLTGALQVASDEIRLAGVTATTVVTFQTNSTERARIPSAGGFVVGTAALATNATTGFLYVPTCAGTPTGTPATQTGTAPIVVDTTNNKLYFYSGGQWRDAGP